MKIQNVSSYKDVEFLDSDTCSKDKKFLAKLNDASIKNKDRVAWYAFNPEVSCNNTACHYGLTGVVPKDYLLNVVQSGYRYANPQNISDNFVKGWWDFIFDPEKSLWKHALHRMAVLRDDNGKPLSILWLNPKDTPSVPLVHMCIAGPRFVTEMSYFFGKSADSILDNCGDYLKAYVGSHLKFATKRPVFNDTGHQGLAIPIQHGVPNGILKGPDKAVLKPGIQWNIYVNKYYATEDGKGWADGFVPSSHEDYSKCWDAAVNPASVETKPVARKRKVVLK